MPKWIDRVQGGIEESGFLEPETTVAKLLAILPTIEEALRIGRTHKQCVEYLKTQGLVLSVPYFTRALKLARKKESKNAKRAALVVKSAPTTQPIGARKASIVRPTHTVVRQNGVVISSPVKDDGVVRTPNMNDFL
jgi:hypothetical protein